MKKYIKNLFCKHKRIWEFYPDYKRVYHGEFNVGGLKISICMNCKKIVKIEDYCE